LLREKSAKDGGLGEGKQEFSFPHYQSFVLLLTGTNCRISDFIYKLRAPDLMSGAQFVNAGDNVPGARFIIKRVYLPFFA
ncbi:MAG: hypothetical protein IKI58_01020, partial [Oscillospiraceae bacterium]|nr:hypothetical protein [Oscillospiraceae bacterium]